MLTIGVSNVCEVLLTDESMNQGRRREVNGGNYILGD